MKVSLIAALLLFGAGDAAGQELPLGADQPPTDISTALPEPTPEEPREPQPDAARDPELIGGQLVEVEEIIVWGEPERRTEAGLLEVRRRAASVSDGLSAQEMSRAPDSAASDAARRVVSVTVEEGKYVLIRGLGDRYVSTLLNGAPLPSTEPDRQAVPLDLFPTSLLANLRIDKSYSAENPASFAGGTLMIESTDYPDDRTVKLKVGSSADTVATGRDQLTYGGGSLDLLGYDDGTRALPDAVPGDRPARISETIDPAAMEDIGESFPNQWTTRDRTAYPNLSLGAQVGDTVPVRRGSIGYLASVSYGHKLQVRESDRAKIRNSGGELEIREEMHDVRGVESAGVGALGAAGWKLGPEHQLDAIALYVHAGESSGEQLSGVSESDAMPIEATRLAFVERTMAFGQLASRHRFRRAHDLELRWQGNLSWVGRDEPDTRDIVYLDLGDGRQRYKNETGSGERFFSELGETGLGTGLDASLPLGRFTLKSGASVQRAERDFSARRFRFDFVGTDPSVLFDPADEIFRPDNIGPAFRLEERTLQTDAYEASQTVVAAHGGAGAELGEDWRLFGGVRYEVSQQNLESGSRFALGMPDAEDQVERTDQAVVPSASAVYALAEAMNLRAAYSYTLARPRFREVAPFLFTDYTRGINISGNPDLVETRIHNADLRWEWFAGQTELVAASLFYKRFREPIEAVVVSATGGDVSFANAAAATSVGTELEARVSLARLHRSLEAFRLWSNATITRSRIELREEQIGSQTSAERPLQGQAPYVVNLGGTWAGGATEVTALYNVVGRRIQEVGFDTLPDTYQQPSHQVDLAASQRLGGDLTLKLGAQNLLNQSLVLVQGPLEVYRMRPGVTVSAALEWAP
ncbi:MAG TPA: TonB-dependent receptor [Kofleriaceae bacterium]